MTVDSPPHLVPETPEPDLPADDASDAADDPRPTGGSLRARWARVRATGEAGMSTAEYAVGTVAACGFGGVLVQVLKDEAVQDMVKRVLLKALSLAGIG